ncbi:MAG TPA: M20 family metallo-hydrolase [Firmicutes bacterium]|nr:M20 family metallo-hydrolase [Bacillota bacterium]
MDLPDYRDEIIEVMCKLIEIPAVNPAYGGGGEYERACWIASFMKREGLEPEIYEVADELTPQKRRPSLLFKMDGKASNGPVLWLVAHLDTVSEGDRSLWSTDPFKAEVRDGRIIGRGAEDNIQAIVSSLFTVLALKRTGRQPECNLGLCFPADEEAGSEYGLVRLINEGIFDPKDEAIVLDAGRPDGRFIEVAEKAVLWLRFFIKGKQAHASSPHLGINASAIGTHFGADLDDLLKAKYGARDYLFEPPYSTFEITQKFDNVSSPNILPGTDSFVMDCRVLPKYPLGSVLGDIEHLISEYEFKTGAKIEYKVLQRADAVPPTPLDAPVVRKLMAAIEKRRGTPTIGGIGGSTCAAFLRRIGMAAVVWSTLLGTAHSPNEYAAIDNVVADTQTLIDVVTACAET